MTQIIVDEHLGRTEVLESLQRWITARKIEELRPGEVIKDDRVLQVLTTLKQSTLVTIDGGFYAKRYRDARYCLLYFVVPLNRQREIPALLRRLFRLPPFKTKAVRMGKVARISSAGIQYWQLDDDELHQFSVYTLPRL
jgi:hypothetical protein